MSIVLDARTGRSPPRQGRAGAVRWITAGVVLAVALIAAGTILIASSSAPQAVSVAGPGAAPARVDRVVELFGLRIRCPRAAVETSQGTYARIDFDLHPSCGTYQNGMTLIVHRVRGRWIPVIAAILWKCPLGSLPAAAQMQLGLCPGGDENRPVWPPERS